MKKKPKLSKVDDNKMESKIDEAAADLRLSGQGQSKQLERVAKTQQLF